MCTSPNEESGPLANNAPLTGYEPNFFDDFHYSETSEIFLQEQSSDTRPSYLHDAEISDDTIGRALSSPLFTQVREEPAGRRQAYHSLEESLLPSQSLSVCHVRTERPVHELSSLSSSIREKPSREMVNETIRILLERQKEHIFAVFRPEIQKHEFQADYDRRSMQELNGIIESQRREIDHTIAGDEQLRRDQLLLHEQLLEQNLDLREAHIKTLYEMEELKRFQGSTFDGFSGRNSSKIETPLNSQPRFRNYRMKLIVGMIREILKMLNQYAVDNPTLPVNQRFSHLFEILAEC